MLRLYEMLKFLYQFAQFSFSWWLLLSSPSLYNSLSTAFSSFKLLVPEATLWSSRIELFKKLNLLSRSPRKQHHIPGVTDTAAQVRRVAVDRALSWRGPEGSWSRPVSLSESKEYLWGLYWKVCSTACVCWAKTFASLLKCTELWRGDLLYTITRHPYSHLH